MSSVPLTHIQLKTATRDDIVLSKVLEFTRHGWPTEGGVKEELRPYERRRHEITIEADCLLLGTRVIIPDKFRERVLEELHRDIREFVV